MLCLHVMTMHPLSSVIESLRIAADAWHLDPPEAESIRNSAAALCGRLMGLSLLEIGSLLGISSASAAVWHIKAQMQAEADAEFDECVRTYAAVASSHRWMMLFVRHHPDGRLTVFPELREDQTLGQAVLQVQPS